MIVCLPFECYDPYAKMARRKSKKAGLHYPSLSVWPAVATAMPFCMLF